MISGLKGFGVKDLSDYLMEQVSFANTINNFFINLEHLSLFQCATVCLSQLYILYLYLLWNGFLLFLWLSVPDCLIIDGGCKYVVLLLSRLVEKGYLAYLVFYIVNWC